MPGELERLGRDEVAAALLESQGFDLFVALKALPRKDVDDELLVGLSGPDIDGIYDAAKNTQAEMRAKIIRGIRIGALALSPAERNWICGYLRSYYFGQLFQCDLAEEKNQSDAVWQQKIDGVIGVCCQLSVQIRFEILASLLGHILLFSSTT